MDNIMTTYALVKDILEENKASRNSDNLLFYLVCKKILSDQDINIDELGFTALFLSLSEYKLPQYETVGRARRKLQHDLPELKASKSVALNREKNMDSFVEFAKEGMM